MAMVDQFSGGMRIGSSEPKKNFAYGFYVHKMYNQDYFHLPNHNIIRHKLNILKVNNNAKPLYQYRDPGSQ